MHSRRPPRAPKDDPTGGGCKTTARLAVAVDEVPPRTSSAAACSDSRGPLPRGRVPPRKAAVAVLGLHLVVVCTSPSPSPFSPSSTSSSSSPWSASSPSAASPCRPRPRGHLRAPPGPCRGRGLGRVRPGRRGAAGAGAAHAQLHLREEGPVQRVRALYGPGGEVVPEALVKEMLPATGEFYGLATMGLTGFVGTGIGDYGVAFGHLGDTYGFQSIIAYFPKLDVGLSVMTNHEDRLQRGPSALLCTAYNRALDLVLHQPLRNCSYVKEKYYRGGFRALPVLAGP
ncbi:unnamed protein product [Prorocentrum cordatum]|uniref:Beta-lactamase-related domain-containing protein n=1 Tax=Prorocentrum cordatum TaxID=2364126 RepID=A0ABN9QTX6_9DINO|nr:unnamed protein product [Polarella glacialis]